MSGQQKTSGLDFGTGCASWEGGTVRTQEAAHADMHATASEGWIQIKSLSPQQPGPTLARALPCNHWICPRLVQWPEWDVLPPGPGQEPRPPAGASARGAELLPSRHVQHGPSSRAGPMAHFSSRK